MAAQRFLELEGLRVFAAVMVVIFHFLVLFYPTMFYGVGHELAPVQHMRFENDIFGLPTGGFISGAFAVAIFFVLSGFVLTIGFFKTGDGEVIKKIAAKRYLRLMIPSLASVLLAWLLFSIGLAGGKTLAEEISQAGSSSTLWAFTPNFFDAVYQGLLGVFVSTLGTLHYNPVLWTMYYEFLGSFLVFGIALLCGKDKHRWIVYTVLILAFWSTWFLGFITGMVLADLYVNRKRIYTLRNRWIIPLSLAVALYFGGYPYSDGATLYSWLDFGIVDSKVLLAPCLAIAATILLWVVLASPKVNAFFKHPYLSSYGKYTFALYLTHLLIMFTIYPAVFVWLHNHLSYNLSVVLAIVITIPAIIVATWLFERYVDGPAILFSKYVGAIYRGDIEVQWSSRRGFVVRKIGNIFRRKKTILGLDDYPTDRAP